MVSSFSIFFIVAFYFYFKQHYEKLIPVKISDPEEKAELNKTLKRKLMIFPAGMVAIVVLYAISFTLMYLYPEVEEVKLSRRIVDVVASVLIVVVFVVDKRGLDKRLSIKKKPEPRMDPNEPGIDIPDDISLN